MLVIADDLTGALDSGVAFAGAGRRVMVARRVADLPDVLRSGAEIVVVSTGTREADAATAQARIREVMAAVDLSTIGLVFKKVDSRLKGRVTEEVAALADGLPVGTVVAVPAIPSMGRVQSQGRLTGMGVAVPIEVAGRFHGPVEVPDARSDVELDRIVGTRSDVLWVGARGLAFALARSLYGMAGVRATPEVAQPFLVAIGSRDPITLAQAEHLSHRVPVHVAPDGRMSAPPPVAPIAALQLTNGGGGRDGASAGADFAEAVARTMAAHRSAALLATGGETADAILDKLGIGTLEIRSEIAPGLPVCEAQAPWGSITVMTKSGGFGAPGLLAEIAGQDAPAEVWETTR
ncbi:four-carbon acid sugar kinase family protein [Allosediminivita pacifica]|uniref:four-carbon acid sugar kinase family protein n=1 Tax=Allosediminivita pacifica TaxID=1267769 RepID=UPI001FCE3EC4|nr:four-carbon acid sugar kinase family protein [Allosediminivita pacifica]